MPSNGQNGWPALAEGAHTDSFGTRLQTVFDTLGALCVGIDPHPYLLSSWGLPDSAAGVREFGLRVVAAASGVAGIVKPQVAFFERHGSAGFAALETVLAAARAAGVLVIADAKRGDLGTSVEAYGEAWLSPGSPLEADALTINAYMGVGSIAAPMALAEKHGKGLFVLAATSNPEAGEIQLARRFLPGHSSPVHSSLSPQAAEFSTTVASSIVAEVTNWNLEHSRARPSFSLGSIGVVLGATVNFANFEIDLDSLTHTPVLAPGFGHQGARYDQLGAIFAQAAPVTIVSASRSILQSGPTGIAGAIIAHSREVQQCRR